MKERGRCVLKLVTGRAEATKPMDDVVMQTARRFAILSVGRFVMPPMTFPDETGLEDLLSATEDLASAFVSSDRLN